MRRELKEAEKKSDKLKVKSCVCMCVCMCVCVCVCVCECVCVCACVYVYLPKDQTSDLRDGVMLFRMHSGAKYLMRACEW